jgi:glycosyltransferase involved in cell wall biosynthesis
MNKHVSTILRKTTKQDDEAYNILTMAIHERYQGGMDNINANFYMFHSKDNIKPWNHEYGKVPTNHYLLPSNELPKHIDFDAILCQNIAHINLCVQLKQQYNIPIINLFHVLPLQKIPPNILRKNREQLDSVIKQQVFISDFNRKEWGWDNTNAKVIKHCVDSDFFRPSNIERKPQILSVCNDWINRNIPCGFQLWANIIRPQSKEQLPFKVLGNTPGLSKAAKNIEELRDSYNESLIFLNTSLISPIPTVVLEAMACGNIVVSTNTCMLPEVIKHGENGLLFNPDRPGEAREMLVDILKNPNKYKHLGENARKTMLTDFSKERFTKEWDNLLKLVIK